MAKSHARVLGLIPIPVETVNTAGRPPKNKGQKQNGDNALPPDQLGTNLPGIEEAMKDPEGALRARNRLFGLPASDEASNHTIGPESIVCVLSTTSCFAPRVPDR